MADSYGLLSQFAVTKLADKLRGSAWPNSLLAIRFEKNLSSLPVNPVSELGVRFHVDNFATRAHGYRAVQEGLQKQLMIMETAFVSYLAAIGQKHDYDS